MFRLKLVNFREQKLMDVIAKALFCILHCHDEVCVILSVLFTIGIQIKRLLYSPERPYHRIHASSY